MQELFAVPAERGKYTYECPLTKQGRVPMKKRSLLVGGFLLLFAVGIIHAQDCGESPANTDRSGWTTVFESKTCCLASQPQSGYWLKIIHAPLQKGCLISTFELLFLQRNGETEKVLYRETLGVGAWCHAFFYDNGAVGGYSEGPSATDSTLLLWTDGQATRAYAFVVQQSSIKKVFEETEGRASYSFEHRAGSNFPDIVEHDSSWHIQNDYLPPKLLAKLKGHKHGTIVYRYDGQAYKLLDVRPDTK
jgi:hypothetical protein